MARGRMINNKIAMDKRVHDLSDDTSRLAFTWLVTFADKEGRTYGDPAIVRSLLFPRRTDITVEAMERYLAEWHDAGLILWYEAEGDKWVYFPGFANNQKGLDTRYEPESAIPSPPLAPEIPQGNPREIPGKSQRFPREIPVEEKRNEMNRREEKGAESASTTTASANVYAEYERASALPITPLLVDELKELESEFGALNVVDSIHEAVKAGATRFGPNYLRAILDRWAKEGKGGKPRRYGREPPQLTIVRDPLEGIRQL